MLKKRFNLRILATIVACLAVTAVFASCDKDGNDDDDGGGSGKIDTKLVGKWEFMDDCYYFFKDGKFDYLSSGPSLYKGKYSISSGRISLSDIVNVNFESTKYKNQNLEYSFGTDAQGEYLFISQYEPLSEAYGGDVSTWEPKKWRKDKTFVP